MTYIVSSGTLNPSIPYHCDDMLQDVVCSQLGKFAVCETVEAP